MPKNFKHSICKSEFRLHCFFDLTKYHQVTKHLINAKSIHPTLILIPNYATDTNIILHYTKKISSLLINSSSKRWWYHFSRSEVTVLLIYPRYLYSSALRWLHEMSRSLTWINAWWCRIKFIDNETMSF